MENWNILGENDLVEVLKNLVVSRDFLIRTETSDRNAYFRIIRCLSIYNDDLLTTNGIKTDIPSNDDILNMKNMEKLIIGKNRKFDTDIYDHLLLRTKVNDITISKIYRDKVINEIFDRFLNQLQTLNNRMMKHLVINGITYIDTNGGIVNIDSWTDEMITRFTDFPIKNIKYDFINYDYEIDNFEKLKTRIQNGTIVTIKNYPSYSNIHDDFRFIVSLMKDKRINFFVVESVTKNSLNIIDQYRDEYPDPIIDYFTNDTFDHIKKFEFPFNYITWDTIHHQLPNVEHIGLLLDELTVTKELIHGGVDEFDEFNEDKFLDDLYNTLNVIIEKLKNKMKKLKTIKLFFVQILDPYTLKPSVSIEEIKEKLDTLEIFSDYSFINGDTFVDPSPM